MKDGVPLVRTSDSEEGDSDSELEDLSTILNKKRRVRAPPADSKPAMPKTSRVEAGSAYDLRSHFRRKPRREFKSIIPAQQKYKTSLSDLVADQKKGLDSEARVLEAQRKAEAAGKAAEESKESNRLTIEGLSAALGDAESVQRTFDALQRTEALETNKVWHFFDANSAEIATRSKPEFPAQSLPGEGWQTRLLDSSTRDATFISGIMKSRVYREALPDEIVLWMIDEVCHNRKEDLTDAYLGVLESSTPQLRKLLDRQAVSSLFRKLGARRDAVAIEGEIHEIEPVEVQPNDPKKPLPHGSRRLLEFLTRAAPFLESGTVEYSLEVLIRLNFDDSVRQDGDVQIQCQEAIAAMFSAPSVEESDVLHRVSQALFNNFRNHGPRDDRCVNHVLQAQLVHSLPAITRREATFQRRLALAFFLDNPKPLTLSLTAPGILPAILQSLTHNGLYRFSRSTDYADVTAAFVLLDTAVDYGFSDRAFTQTLCNIDRRTRDVAARQLRDAARAAEGEFNLGIDALTATVRRIMGQIRGSGTESVRMSEAKGAMERLVYRLESSVRTREKSSTDIFADTGGKRSAGFMESWMGGAGSGSGGRGVVEEVSGNAPKKEENGGVNDEREDEGRNDVADQAEQDVEDVVDEDVGDDAEHEVDGA